jgi:hypothetical protein
MVDGGRPTDWIFLGVLTSGVPRDAVDEAIEATGKAAKRAGGKLPPHVMVYFAMALALFADDDYEEVAGWLAGTLRDWDVDENREPSGHFAVFDYIKLCRDHYEWVERVAVYIDQLMR